MKATFMVKEIKYEGHRTTVALSMGVVSDHRLGEGATLVLVGSTPLELSPGNLVIVDVNPTGHDQLQADEQDGPVVLEPPIKTADPQQGKPAPLG